MSAESCWHTHTDTMEDRTYRIEGMSQIGHPAKLVGVIEQAGLSVSYVHCSARGRTENRELITYSPLFARGELNRLGENFLPDGLALENITQVEIEADSGETCELAIDIKRNGNSLHVGMQGFGQPRQLDTIMTQTFKSIQRGYQG